MHLLIVSVTLPFTSAATLIVLPSIHSSDMLAVLSFVYWYGLSLYMNLPGNCPQLTRGIHFSLCTVAPSG